MIKKAGHCPAFFLNFFRAESQGFEPWRPFWSLHALQACALDHSANSPQKELLRICENTFFF